MRRTESHVLCRDGVRLATDVYLPEGDGPFPVILERTPYGKREVSRSERTESDPVPVRREVIAAYFNGHGYAVVYQDCRGRYGSEGSSSNTWRMGRTGSIAAHGSCSRAGATAASARWG